MIIIGSRSSYPGPGAAAESTPGSEPVEDESLAALLLRLLHSQGAGENPDAGGRAIAPAGGDPSVG